MPKPLTNAQKAKFFFALGHVRRLRIIDTLQNRPKGLTFEELELLARVPGASLSHHLRFLKEAGIVSRTVKARYSIYALHTEFVAWMKVSQSPETPMQKAA